MAREWIPPLAALILAASPGAAAADRDARSVSPFLSERETALEIGFGEGEAGRRSAEAVLRDPADYRRRLQAAVALGRSRDPLAVNPLIEALAREKSPSVRRAAARSLGLLGDAAMRAVAAAEADGILTGEDGRLFARAMVAGALERLLAYITDPSGDIKGFFHDPLAELAPLGPRASDALREVVQSRAFNEKTKTIAVRALGDLGDPAAVEDLLPLVRLDPFDAGAELARSAVFALYRLGEKGPFQELEKDLKRAIARAEDYVQTFEHTHGPLRHPRNRDAFLEELQRLDKGIWELAYAYNQVREYDKAVRHYELVVSNQEALNKGAGEFGFSTSYLYLSHYNLACIHAQRRDVEAALRALRKAVRTGFRDFNWIERDRDLDPIRDDPRFRQILSRAR